MGIKYEGNGIYSGYEDDSVSCGMCRGSGELLKSKTPCTDTKGIIHNAGENCFVCNGNGKVKIKDLEILK